MLWLTVWSLWQAGSQAGGPFNGSGKLVTLGLGVRLR